MRDLDKQPYSKDEQRVAGFFFERGIGGGDDPIGSLIASHEYLIAERKGKQSTLSLPRGPAITDLREYTAMKYAGDCKCGKCQLVPRHVLDECIAERDVLVKALGQIAAMDPKSIRADDLGRAARIAREVITDDVGGSSNG